MLFFSFFPWLIPDLLSTQDLRKQVAPLLKSFQGEVSEPLCSLLLKPPFVFMLVIFLITVTKHLTEAT